MILALAQSTGLLTPTGTPNPHGFHPDSTCGCVPPAYPRVHAGQSGLVGSVCEMGGEALAHIYLGIARARLDEDQPAAQAKINNDRHRRQLVKGRC